MNGAPKKDTCASIASQYADVCVPIKLEPYAIVGELVTECCGEPIVTLRQCQNACGCEITISQKLCIRIPIEYGTKSEVFQSSVSCKRTC